MLGEGISAYGGLPFPDTGCPVPYVGYIYLVNDYEIIQVWHDAYVLIHLPKMFLSADYLFE